MDPQLELAGVGDRPSAEGARIDDNATFGVLIDFFLIHQAAGVVASCSVGESSFSTVAALAGGAPLFLPFSSSDGVKRVSTWQVRENGGKRLGGMYFNDSVDQFRSTVSELAREVAVTSRPADGPQRL